MSAPETETETAPVPAAPAEAPPEKDPLEEARDAAEPKDDATGGAKPPEDGHCRECRRLRRLNRLKLCYPCWVALSLAEKAKQRGEHWQPGQAHPSWCDCDGLGEHKNADGTARGLN